MLTRLINVGQSERIGAGFIAAVLLASAIEVRHPWRLAAVACLFYRAFSGHCFGYEWLGLNTCKLRSKS